MACAELFVFCLCSGAQWRLNNRSARVRQQAADLIGRIAVVMKTCDEIKLLGHLGMTLFEYLGEEYPEVLGSILGALKGSHCSHARGSCCVSSVDVAVHGLFDSHWRVVQLL